MADEPFRCAFCLRVDSVGFLEKGQASLVSKYAAVCPDCIMALSDRILNKDKSSDRSTQFYETRYNFYKERLERVIKKENNVLTPKQIVKKLDEKVIGQEKAKKVLSVALYQHQKRINNPFTERNKSNILLIGPTGSGKTLLIETLAKITGVPFIILDATHYTESGYSGGDVADIPKTLLKAADDDVALAQKGIIYIDEIDKLRVKEMANNKDISGMGVQKGLLKLIEGADLPINKQGSGETMNTRNILFIFGGSFHGIEALLQNKSSEEVSHLGFNAELRNMSKKSTNDIYDLIDNEDLIKFGLLPEFIGRISYKAILKELSEQDLVKIITEPKNSLYKQFEEMFSMDGVQLKLTSGAIKTIAKKALEKNVGARGLKSIMDDLFLELLYDIPGRDDIEKIVINQAVVEGKERVKLILKGDKDENNE